MCPDHIQTLSDVVRARGWDTDRFSRYELPAIVGNIERRLERRLPDGARFSLTSLQRQALNDPRLWGPDDPDRAPQNIIIQGATSAGKTLISELAILDVLAHQGKALVLVPLKAMVRERAEHFKADIERCPHEYRVFGSSSDFMDNDDRLIHGRYEVGVLVYEKLFSMLNQPDCTILDGCRLIVVDELSMLSKEDRGPKLEVALEIIRELSPQTRIMCLATSDCSAANVARWLGTPAGDGGAVEPCPVIASSARPLGLDEYLVRYNGSYRFRHIASEGECGRLDDVPGASATGASGDTAPRTQVTSEDVGKLEVAGYNRDDKDRQKERKLLLALLDKLYGEQPDAKVLVFVGTRGKTSSIARFIRENASALFPHKVMDPGLAEKLATCDDDADRRELEQLLPHGIAFHHAGLSTNLRELVEEEFAAHLRLVVATETLTVGVNLPFDAMIMMDYKVPRGEGRSVAVSNQEYRNFIGRAGRLGQSNRCGTSFLMVDDLADQDKYWYGLTRSERIDSALRGASVAQRAPYFLGLLHGGRHDSFTLSDIERQHARSFACACGQQDARAEEIADALVDAWACEKPQNAGGRGGFIAAVAKEKTYSLNLLGIAVAPYALSLETMSRIVYYFANGVAGEGLPAGTTRDDIAHDRYLLEILYRICQHPEVSGLSMLRMPSVERGNDFHEAESIVKRRLKEMLDERDGEGAPVHALWGENRIDGCLDELLGNVSRIRAAAEKLQCALRAIVLYWWAQGETVEGIKRRTGFGGITHIVAGDLERLADVVSYHIEAIHRCLTVAENGEDQILVGDALSEFRSLQVRMRYGMGKDLAVLASKHVHGLDRSRVLAVGACAREIGLAPIEALFVLPDQLLLKHMTRHQLNELRRLVGDRYASTKLDGLIRVMRDDMGATFQDGQRDSLERLGAWEFDDPLEAQVLIKDVLIGQGMHDLAPHPGSPGLFDWRIVCDGGVQRRYVLGVLPARGDARDLAQRLADEPPIGGHTAAGRIAIVPAAGTGDARCALEEFAAAYPGDRTELLVMDKDFFTLLLAWVVLMRQGGHAQGAAEKGKEGDSALVALASFLADAVGSFAADDQRAFSLINYLPHKSRQEDPDVLLLCNASKGYGNSAFTGLDLKDALEEGPHPLAVELVAWDELAQKGPEGVAAFKAPAVVFLERSQIERSRCLMEVMYRMRQDEKVGAGRGLVLFDSDGARANWERADELASKGDGLAAAPLAGQQWYAQLAELPWTLTRTLADAASAVREFAAQPAHAFLIGVSYGHYDPARPHGGAPDDAEERQWRSDTEKLDELTSALAKRYGRGRVLYDGFPEHAALFHGVGAQGDTLKAYGQCRLYLVLDCVWTAENANCKAELDVIRARCAAGEAACLALRPTNPAHRYKAEGLFTNDDYTTPLGIAPEELCALAAQKIGF